MVLTDYREQVGQNGDSGPWLHNILIHLHVNGIQNVLIVSRDPLRGFD